MGERAMVGSVHGRTSEYNAITGFRPIAVMNHFESGRGQHERACQKEQPHNRRYPEDEPSPTSGRARDGTIILRKAGKTVEIEN